MGRTQKHLTTRVDEHLGDEGSSIFKHSLDNPECTHPDIKKQFKVLKHARSKYELALKEVLYQGD